MDQSQQNSGMTNELVRSGAFGCPEEALGFIGSVLEASTEHSMIATDSDGVIRLWNEGARRLYGYAASEIIGRSWSVLHTEADVGAGLTQEVVDQTLREGKWTGPLSGCARTAPSSPPRVVTTRAKTPAASRGLRARLDATSPRRSG